MISVMNIQKMTSGGSSLKKTCIDYNEISIKNDAPQAKFFRDIQSGNAIFLTKKNEIPKTYFDVEKSGSKK